MQRTGPCLCLIIKASPHNYPCESEYNKCKSLMTAYNITAVQSQTVRMFRDSVLHKIHLCCFSLQFHLPSQEGEEGETKDVYSFSNKETNYKGLSNCMGNSQEIFLEKAFVPNPINFTLLRLVYNGLPLCELFQRTNLQVGFCAAKKTADHEGGGTEGFCVKDGRFNRG